MRVLADIQTTKDKVIHFLKIKEEYRDDDEKLVATFWHTELRDRHCMDSKTLSAYSFLEMYSTGQLTPADIVARSRRLAQSQNVELRGKKYSERKRKEKEVRQNINK